MRIVFFASLREALDCPGIELDLNEEISLSDLIKQLIAERGESWREQLTAENIRVALNQEIVTGNPMISPNAEVAFFHRSLGDSDVQRHIQVQEAPFSLEEEHTRLKSAALSVGAVATFVGSVRDINDDADVSVLYLEHYPGMTEKEIDKIIDIAIDRWSLLAVTVIHRIGALHPGDDIVFVGVASEHRGASFAACEFVMDYLKTRATFWKKETTKDGDRWLTTRQSDVDAAESWSDPG